MRQCRSRPPSSMITEPRVYVLCCEPICFNTTQPGRNAELKVGRGESTGFTVGNALAPLGMKSGGILR